LTHVQGTGSDTHNRLKYTTCEYLWARQNRMVLYPYWHVGIVDNSQGAVFDPAKNTANIPPALATHRV